MEKELNINVVPNANGEIHIFHHQGADPKKTIEPTKIEIVGEIESPLLFTQDRDYSPEISIVLFNREELKIVFQANPENPMAPEVTGVLKYSEDFDAFKINTDKFFSKDQVIKLIKERVHCFESMKEAKTLEAKLRNFAMKVEQQIKESDDQKGASSTSIIRNLQVDKEILQPRSLTFPIFMGGKEVSIDVEVVVHPDRPMFGFQSWDLNKILEDQKKTEFDTVVSALKKQFVCIQIG